jgi:hypothetical protein
MATHRALGRARVPALVAGVAAAAAMIAVVPDSAARLPTAALAATPLVHGTSISIGARAGSPLAGIGAVAGGGGTARLLIDYPEPQRTQILDYLFKPGYGADIQILKLEIGGDAEATDAAEPSFWHSRLGVVNCNAGYEMWLARQAKAINPRIVLTALQWNAPGWVGHQAEQAWTQTDITYLLRWLKCAKSYGMRIPYLGGFNEHLPHGKITPAIMQWFINLRAALNQHGYRYVRLIAVDSARRDPDVSDMLAGHPKFARAIGVLGYHDICRYPTTGLACTIPPAARTSGKRIWATEIGALRPPGGSAALARTINNAYIQTGTTGILEYPLITSMPGGMPEENRGLVIANQPWSGYYQVPLTTWVVAQTTQFTKSGWLHAGSGQFGGSYGTYVAYMARDRSYWSLVAQTSDAAGPQTITVHLAGRLHASAVHVWATNLRGDVSTWFVRKGNITPRSGTFRATLKAGYIYSFTTTTRQGKGVPSPAIPNATPMIPATATMPGYTTTPAAGQPWGPDTTLEPWALEPEDGSFEYPSATSTHFVQTTAGRPDFWQPPNSREIARFPYAVIGDYCLGNVAPSAKTSVPAYCNGQPADYTVTATVTFTGTSQSAGVIARYNRPITSPVQYFLGYRFMVSQSGAWKVYRDFNAPTNKGGPAPKVLQSGQATLATGSTHSISLKVAGTTLTAGIDGATVWSGTDPNPSPYLTGVAGIATGGWYPVQFDNVTISR